MKVCEESRKELETWDAFESLAGLISRRSDGLPCDGEEKFKRSVLHVQSCIACKKWLEAKVSLDVNEHLSKIEKYCCPLMYGAVEQATEHEINLRLVNFQGDAVWAISNFGSVGGNLLISYCPWCGSKLPSKPFAGGNSENS